MAKSLVHILLLFTILSSGWIAHADNAKSAFLTTTPVKTTKGIVYIEVQTYQINNPSDLITFRDHYLKNINTGTNEHFSFSFKTDDFKGGALDNETKSLFSYLTSVTKAKTIRKAREVVVAAGQNVKSYYRENKLNITLAVFRLFANGAVVSTGLIRGAGIIPEHALLVGALAGGFSAALQIKGDFFLKWLENSRKLVGLAQKYNLINKLPKKFKIRNITYKSVVGTETLTKWYGLEAVFLGLCQGAMYLLDIPIKENLFETSLKSTLSQGIYETGITKAAKTIERINPAWGRNIGNFKNITLFAGSAVSVVAAVGSMVGIPFANLGFVVLSAGGLVFHIAPKITAKKDALMRLFKLAPKETELEQSNTRQKRPAVIMSCQKLFAG